MPQTADERRTSKAASMRRLRARRRAERRGSDLFTPAPIVARTRGGDPALAVARWCEAKLRVPFGPLMGQPFLLEAYQVAWLREALKPGMREAGLSIARKNGKSGLVGALVLAYLDADGPLHRAAWRGLVVSQTGALAKGA